MKPGIAVVDVFAGPGGLAEGFSSLTVDGRRLFDVRLSVEKDPAAFATLRLRTFVRQFGSTLPTEYYDFLDGKIAREALLAAYPDQWDAACAETMQLELGSDGAGAVLDPCLDEIRKASGRMAVLIGGPPCQAYSIVGRARNRGNINYIPSEDQRHFLYREYIRIIGKLEPAIFVMENVTGFLTARVDGESIFRKVKADLRAAGGEPDSYVIFPLVQSEAKGGREHIIQAEQFGVPQRRHRVILFGVRRDLTGSHTGLPLFGHTLMPRDELSTVEDVIAGMPAIRSRLSRGEKGEETWRKAVLKAIQVAATAALDEEDESLDQVVGRLAELTEHFKRTNAIPPLQSRDCAAVRQGELAEWIIDPRLRSLPNHEARSHMEADLARYVFASVFAQVHERTPKAKDYPAGLAPDHESWGTGSFNDRFRVQISGEPSTTVTSHISKDGHYFIHPDPRQCRTLSVREAARLQTFPDNYFFEGTRTQQYVQVGNAVPPLLARQIAQIVERVLSEHERATIAPARVRGSRRSVA